MANLSVTTFSQAIAKLGNSQKRIRVGNNTTIEATWTSSTGDDSRQAVLVRLHGHGIVLLHDNGDVSVRDCGYVTMTTYDRIRAFLPCPWTAEFMHHEGQVRNRVTGERHVIQAQDWRWVPA